MAMHWYSVSVLTNLEKRVAERINSDAARSNMSGMFEKVVVPTEEVMELRRGKKVSRERRFMPGYILIKMEMTDESYHLVNQINGVTGFLGRPTPLSDNEVKSILNRAEQGATQPRALITYEVGEDVSVIDGPFEGFNGRVEEVDEETARLKVSVSIFGRATPVDLEYSQVSKQS